MRRTELISKIIIFLLLVTGVTISFVNYSNTRYQEGLSLTEEEYITNFSKYKEELLSSQDNINFRYSFFLIFIVFLILVGAYEGSILIVNLIVKKIVLNTAPVESKILLTVAEAQELTGLKLSYLKKAIEEGSLKTLSIGNQKKIKIKRTELDRFIEKF